MTIDGAATYVGAVTGDAARAVLAPRREDGTLVADASGHGHVARLQPPGDERNRTGARRPTPTAAKTDGRVWYDSSYDLIRAPLADGPADGRPRTVEAWVWSDNAGARLINYGDFSVEAQRARRSPSAAQR